MIEDIKRIKIEELSLKIKQIQDEIEQAGIEAKNNGVYVVNDIKKKEEITNIRREIDRIKESRTLKEVGIEFNDAIEFLNKRGIPLVLTEEDKVITENETEFEEMGDCVFIHRTNYLPEEGVIKTGKSAGALSYNNMYTSVTVNGEKYDIETKSGRDTVHCAVNGEVSEHSMGNGWDSMKYTIIIPGAEIDEQQLAGFRPEDSWFKGDVKLPRGAYLLVPAAEREEVAKRIPGVNVVGYEGEPKGYGDAFISSMGYKNEKVHSHGWENEDDSKLISLAEKKGIYSGKHFDSLERNEEKREEANNYIAEVFKVVKKNKEKYSGMPDIEGLDGAFFCSFHGCEDSPNYRIEHPEFKGGIDQLLYKLDLEGLGVPNEEKKFIHYYMDNIEGQKTDEHRVIFQQKITQEVIQKILQEKKMDDKFVEEFQETAEDPRTIKEVQLAQSKVKSAVLDRTPEEIENTEELTQ